MKQLLVLLLLLVGTAVAEEPRGTRTHELYNSCEKALNSIHSGVGSAADALGIGFCWGYMRGLADGLPSTRNGVSTEALARSFVRYIDNHPGDMDSPTPVLMITNAWIADGIIDFKLVPKQ